MKILVLGGGISPEHEVSLRSAKNVAEAARQAGFEVAEADPADGLAVLDDSKGSVVLPILHGKNGEDGVIQKEFEARNLAFLGSGSAVSAECFDKWLTRRKLEAAGINMPKAALVHSEDYPKQPLAAKPHVLKVSRGGSSIGTLMAHDPENISQQSIDELFKLDDTAVLEELVEGNEITVPVLDGKALPVIEIIPPQNEEFDYENKYNGRTQELCPPKNVSEPAQEKAQRLAEKVHTVMGARHLSRVDIMIDKNNDLYVLEINTMPGMTSGSLYPKSAKQAGMDMPALVRKFVELVRRDYKL